jgi:hypothetical protein
MDYCRSSGMFTSAGGGRFTELVQDLFHALANETSEDLIDIGQTVRSIERFASPTRCVLDFSFVRVLRADMCKSAREMRKKMCAVCDLIERCMRTAPTIHVMAKPSEDGERWICRALVLMPVELGATCRAIGLLRSELGIEAASGRAESIFSREEYRRIEVNCQYLNALFRWVDGCAVNDDDIGDDDLKA